MAQERDRKVGPIPRGNAPFCQLTSQHNLLADQGYEHGVLAVVVVRVGAVDRFDGENGGRPHRFKFCGGAAGAKEGFLALGEAPKERAQQRLQRIK